MTRRVFDTLALLAAGLATIAIVSTYPRLSQGYDEPLHLAGGLELLQYGSTRLNTENPPLARLAVALGPFLSGARLPPMAEWDPRGDNPPGPIPMGNRVLYRDDHYVRNLTQARVGIIPFFWLLVGVVWMWAGGRQEPLRGAIAVIATVTVPSILAFAGLAITDIPFVAVFLATLYALTRVIEDYRIANVLVFAVWLAVAILTKFSTLVFFGPAALTLAIAYVLERGIPASLTTVRQTPWLRVAGLAALATVVVAILVWAGYRFTIGPIADVSHRLGFGATLVRNGVLPWWATVPVPAPELWHGLLSLRRTVSVGHRAYLFGELSQTGFWNYYFVGLAVKTPLPLLVFAVTGAAYTLRHLKRPGASPYTGAALAALAILAVAAMSTLNYGSRHVLVVYPLLAISAAWGWHEFLRSGARRSIAAVILTALLVWPAAIAVRTHPDYLSYFNELAGSDPGRIVVETDLDWGQDFLQLKEYLRAHEIRRLRVAYFGTVLQCRHDIGELLPLEPGVPATGWIAISEVYAREIFTIGLKRHPCDERSAGYPTNAIRKWYTWLNAYEPTARIGRSIRVYHIPER